MDWTPVIDIFQQEFEEVSGYPALPPPPVPPVFAKQEIYMDPVVFAEVDQRAISIAQEDQKTFTDLVRQLGCAHSPVEFI